MHHSNQTDAFTPWHREPWVWFIVAIILVTFAWGAFSVMVSFNNRDTVVVDDYYKVGKVINEDLSRENRALEWDISALISVDDLTGEVRARVTGNLPENPDILRLRFSSPAFRDNDRDIMLRLTPSGDYMGNLTSSVGGRYYVQLETLDEQIPEQPYQTGWRLNNELVVEPGTPVALFADKPFPDSFDSFDNFDNFDSSDS